ncbi:hypothetical protein WA158_007230 [Blastocystis sp. Blastoise]
MTDKFMHEVLVKDDEFCHTMCEKYGEEFFANLGKGQHPEILWIGCSDSRVPASDILGLEAGHIFTHRNIANLVSDIDISVQTVLAYAVEHLKVKHIILCGHSHCGGVDVALHPSENEGVVGTYIQPLRDILNKHKEEIDSCETDAKKSKTACWINMGYQVKNLIRNPYVVEAWENGQELTIHGILFHISNGKIEKDAYAVSSLEEAKNFELKDVKHYE